MIDFADEGHQRRVERRALNAERHSLVLLGLEVGMSDTLEAAKKPDKREESQEDELFNVLFSDLRDSIPPPPPITTKTLDPDDQTIIDDPDWHDRPLIAMSARVWPGNVPSAPEALRALREPDCSQGQLARLTEDVRKALTVSEIVALGSEDSTPSVVLLRRSAVARLRVTAALSTAPAADTILAGEAEADAQELLRLLSELDELLGSLRHHETNDQGVQRDLDASKELIVRGATQIAGLGHEMTGERISQPLTERPLSTPKVLQPTFSNPPSTEKSFTFLRFALILSLLAAGLFHALRFSTHSTTASEPAPVPFGAPIIPVKNGGPIVFVTEPGQTPTREEVERAADRARASGRALVRAGPNRFMLGPVSVGPSTKRGGE